MNETVIAWEILKTEHNATLKKITALTDKRAAEKIAVANEKPALVKEFNNKIIALQDDKIITLQDDQINFIQQVNLLRDEVQSLEEELAKYKATVVV